MMKLKTREAIIGVVAYRLLRYAVKRTLGKGGGMASAKRVGLLAMITAAIGALFFWRKKRKGTEGA